MLAICISVAMGSGVFNTALALAVGTIPIIARQLRSSTMLINSQEYIEAARSFGESNFKIIMTHVIPNCMAPILSLIHILDLISYVFYQYEILT